MVSRSRREASPLTISRHHTRPLPLEPGEPNSRHRWTLTQLGQHPGRKDQKKREDRADVLTYTSEVLTEDLTVIGPLSRRLHTRTSLEHTDFFVRLCDVSPRGRSENLSDGIIRLRPGDVTKSGDGSFSVRISMWPTANTFRRGHRVRLQVSSGAHPLFVRNTGTDEPLASATRLSTANQEIFHDADHRSAVVLPVSPL